MSTLLIKFLVDSLSKSLHICACRSCELRKSLAQKRSMPEQTSGDLSNPIRTREVLMNDDSTAGSERCYSVCSE